MLYGRRELTGAVNDGEHIDLLRENSVDDSVRTFDEFPNIHLLVLGYRTSRLRKRASCFDREVRRSTIRRA